MSVSTEVQRTLVKSPPELWSELSDPEALARHLAELGEIHITDIEPETKVEWEAEGASGVVRLKQSGWGTKVTLSVTRVGPEAAVEAEEAVEAGEADALVESEPAAEAKAETEAIELERAGEADAVVEPAPAGEAEAAVEPEPPGEAEAAVELETAVEPEREPQPGLFARLFRRRRKIRAELVTVEPELLKREPEPAEAEPIATVAPEPEYEFEALAAPEPVYVTQFTKAAADLAAELVCVEAQMEQETTELLTGVLDRLGAAHHRPFSRG